VFTGSGIGRCVKCVGAVIAFLIAASCSSEEPVNVASLEAFEVLDRLPPPVDETDSTEVRDVTSIGSSGAAGGTGQPPEWMSRITPEFDTWAEASNEEWVDEIGVDPATLTSTASGGRAPSTYVMLVGDIDSDAVTDALRRWEQAPQDAEAEGWRFFNFPGTEVVEDVLPRSPLNGQGRALRFAVRDGVLVASTSAAMRDLVVLATEQDGVPLLTSLPGMSAIRSDLIASPPVQMTTVSESQLATLETPAGSAVEVVYGEPTRSALLLGYETEEAAVAAAEQFESDRGQALAQPRVLAEFSPPEPLEDIWRRTTITVRGAVVAIDLGDTTWWTKYNATYVFVQMRCQAGADVRACEPAVAS
jgi:hypothetical protein